MSYVPVNAISVFPWVDKDCVFVLLRTPEIFFNVFALSEESFFIADSPSVADSMALTSLDVFEIISIFKS